MQQTLAPTGRDEVRQLYTLQSVCALRSSKSSQFYQELRSRLCETYVEIVSARG
jgi:hypothetical protein